MTQDQRWFFVHLQKTAGTALFQRLRDHFGADAIYPLPVDRGDVPAVTDVKHLQEVFRAHRAQLRVVTGHFPLCVTEVLDAPFTTFTLLRDPVERTLSLLRRRHAIEDRFRDSPLEAIYEAPDLQNIIRNHMVKMLSMTRDEMTATPLMAPGVFDASRLARAKQNLEQVVDVVGLQEDFETFCHALEIRYGWDLGPPRYANRTQPLATSEAFKGRIARDNAMDVELYEFAREVLGRRAATSRQ